MLCYLIFGIEKIFSLENHYLNMETGRGWKQFVGKQTPSTVELSELFFKKVPTETKVVDFGCAWGRVGFELQKKGYHVCGFDINEHSIEYASEQAKKTNNKYPGKIDFITADALNLPYKTNYFDACIMQAFLTTVTNSEARNEVIKEAWRVLAPGGILYLADFGQNWNNPLYKARYLRDYSSTGEKGTFFVTEDGKEGGKELFLVHHYTLEELKQLLKKRFAIETTLSTTFKTFHGNNTLGYIILAKKI